MQLTKTYKIAFAVLGALVALGVGAYVSQFVGGLGVTGMSNGTSWGLYIASFMFFVGLSAGGLIVASSASIFHVTEYKKVALPAIIVSLICICIAGAFVLIDLGGIVRILNLFASPNFVSPLLWDICVITTYLVINLVYLYFMTSKKPGAQHKVAIVSRFALPVAILVHSVTAWIFGLQQAHEFWHTALLGPWFVSSALVCGTALVLVVVIALRRAGYLELEQRYVTRLAKMLGAFVLVDLYFFGCDLLTSAFPEGSGAEVVAMLTTGSLAPFFWAEIVGCALAAVVCFVPSLRTNPLIVVASLLAIAGIFCKRVQLLVGGFQIPNVDYAFQTNALTVTNWEGGFEAAYQGMVYWPTALELGVALGILGLGALMLCVGLKFLPLKQAENVH